MLLGAVLGFKKQKYLIFNQRGREIELAANRLHAVPGRFPADAATLDQKTSFLSTFADKAHEKSASYGIEELWGVVHSEHREYTTRDLCDLLTGGVDALDYLAVRFALADDKVFFKRERDGFLPRSESTVQELKHAEEVRERKSRLRGTMAEWIELCHKSPGTPVPEELLASLTLLEEVAAYAQHIENNKHKEAKDLVDYCAQQLSLELNGNREQRAYGLLAYAKHFTESTNLPLIRHRPPRRFSRESLQEAEALVVPERLEDYPEEFRRHRVDLSSVATFTIDDVTTLDMDDALSIERTRDGYLLGIHISDVASMIPVGSALEKTAHERATSLYLPDQTVHMLPEALSEDKLSLREGKLRPTLSCLVTLSSSLQVLGAEIKPSVIRSTRRYSYDEVEALLERDGIDPSNESLSLLYQLAGVLEQERLERGAQKVFKRDLVIDVADDGSFALREIDEHGPARGLVGEMMVLGNALLASFAVEKHLPVIFRRQDPPDEEPGSPASNQEPAAGDAAAQKPAADYAGRAKLKKSSVGLEPGLHSGLGLDAYLQGTSPIRRYVDLCNQRQILAALQVGSARFSRAEMEEVLYSTEEPLSTATAVSRETRRFWLMRYLSQRIERNGKEGRIITGTVLRTDMKFPLIELDEVFMPTPVKCAGPVKPGDRVTLRISSVEPQQDYLRLEHVVEPRG